jgi:AP endonuclease 2
MFDILEADIVCTQELKIQRKNLGDDLVLIPGWDCYFSLPKHQSGYSGVSVWCRQSKCQPIRVEEGITGILTPPGKETMYKDLPEEQRIGGYPDLPAESATILDSEGRALVVDFGAFVLINVYCPANRDAARHDFRVMFDQTLFERVRNLVEKEKRRVVVVGDFNIARDVIDMAGAKENMKAQGIDDFKMTETRWALHEILEPYEGACMVDLCREFWPDRRGMYTREFCRDLSAPASACVR